MKKISLLIALSLPIISFGQDTLKEPNLDFSKVKQQNDLPKEKSRNEVEVAKFPGVVNAYLSEKIYYPKAAKKNNIQGLVTLSFQVDTFGNVINVKVKKELDLAVMRKR